jgi:hypothetical protein
MLFFVGGEAGERFFISQMRELKLEEQIRQRFALSHLRCHFFYHHHFFLRSLFRPG